MNTEYQIGENVWFMYDNNPIKGVVTRITIKSKILILYKIDDTHERREVSISDSKQGLMKKVFGLK